MSTNQNFISTPDSRNNIESSASGKWETSYNIEVLVLCCKWVFI